MSEAQVNDVELDLDDAEESSIDVEQPSTVEESTATPEVDLGYTDPVNNDKAEIVEDPKSEDNLQDYSEKTQKRIDKLTRKMREAERREKAALEYAKGVQEELNQKKASLNSIEDNHLKEFDARVDSQREQVKAKLATATADGDIDKIVEANDELTKLAVEKEKAKVRLAQREEEAKETEQEVAPQTAPIDPKAENWISKNTWFNNDTVMTGAAVEKHKELVQQGVDPTSDEYYDEIDKTMRDYFPHKFVEDKKPVQTVASAGRKQQGRRTVKLTRSQVAIAKKLGVPLEEYAKFVKE
jgi:chromosome segregation ATPase